MNRNELRKADINLMVVFETLMLERNVTRVAENCSWANRPSARPSIGCARCSTIRCSFASATAWNRQPGRGNHPAPVAGARFAVGGVEPDPRFRSRQQRHDIPHRPVGRRRVRPVAAPVEQPAARGAANRVRGPACRLLAHPRRPASATSPWVSARRAACRPTPSASCCAISNPACCAPMRRTRR